MSRGTLTITNANQAGAVTLRAEYLLDIAFPSGTVRCTTGDRNLVVGANTYLADGRFHGFSGVSESADLKARRVSIALSGVDPVLVDKVLNDNWGMAEINLFIGLFDEAWALVDDPVPLAPTLYMSNASVTLGKQTGEIEVSAETLEVFNRRNSAVLATPESQKRRYPGDTGLDDLVAIQQREVRWGGKVIKKPIGSRGRKYPDEELL